MLCKKCMEKGTEEVARKYKLVNNKIKEVKKGEKGERGSMQRD